MDNSRSFAHKEISIFCFSDDQSWRKFSVYLSSRPMLHFKDQVSPACIEEDLIFCFHWGVSSRGGSSRRAAGLQPSLKNASQRFRQAAKLALSLDLVTKISQHNHFRYFRHRFCSTFPRNPTKPMFRCFPTTPLMRWRFQHTCRWIWRFWGCLRHNPKGKKPNNWLQKRGSISAYRKAFLIFWRWIFKEKNGGNVIFIVFTTWISWILNVIIKFNNALTSTLAILAALDSNLVANLGLRKYNSSFICTSAACNSRLSWWAF